MCIKDNFTNLISFIILLLISTFVGRENELVEIEILISEYWYSLLCIII